MPLFPTSQQAASAAAHLNLYRRLKPRKWRTELCSELAEVMDFILGEEGVTVLALGFANIKAPDLVAVLNRPPSDQVSSAARAAFGDNQNLIFSETGIACREHYSEIDWAPRPEKAPSGWRRLFGL